MRPEDIVAAVRAAAEEAEMEVDLGCDHYYDTVVTVKALRKILEAS